MTSQLPIPPARPVADRAAPTPAVPAAPRARRVVLALPDTPFGTEARRLLRQRGFEVHRVEPDCAVRHVAWELLPAAVALAAEADGESGWLTGAKLLSAQPGLRVVLVVPHASDRDGRLCRFLGAAALVAESDGPQALVDAVATA